MDAPNRTGVRSVIFVPGQRERDRWERVCHDDIVARSATVAGIVGVDGKGWADAQAMVDRGEADEIVVGRWDHIPAEALPHVRVVAEQQRTPKQRRRPRIIGRGGAAVAVLVGALLGGLPI